MFHGDPCHTIGDAPTPPLTPPSTSELNTVPQGSLGQTACCLRQLPVKHYSIVVELTYEFPPDVPPKCDGRGIRLLMFRFRINSTAVWMGCEEGCPSTGGIAATCGPINAASGPPWTRPRSKS